LLSSPPLYPLGPPRVDNRNSEPGHFRGGAAHEEGRLHRAIELGLGLEVQKDESTKNPNFVWGSVSSLRRGICVLLTIAIGIAVLIIASGHFYFSHQRAQKLINQAQHASAEHRFREDVEALAQAVQFAHFAELAVNMHSKVK